MKCLQELLPLWLDNNAVQRCSSFWNKQNKNKTSVVRELQLCSCFSQDDADAEGLLGQPQEVAISPPLKFEGKTLNLENNNNNQYCAVNRFLYFYPS